MVYITDEIKSTATSMRYVPTPLELPTSTMDKTSPVTTEQQQQQAKMTKEQEEEDFVKNNYVARTLLNEPELPPITWSNWYKEVNWPQATFLCLEPFVALYGLFTTGFMWQTVIFTIIWYFLTGFGITAGYHRLFAHRAYEASAPLKYFLLALGAGSVQGSAQWWSRGHRAHHRYTDTDLDPYSAHKGVFYSHIGWLLFKPRRRPGVADVTDLTHDKTIQWQHRHYLSLALFMAFIFPTLVCGLGWGDYRGGYFFAGVLRLVFLHHSTFCVNSLAHYLGDRPFDDRHTPRDHFITALVTLGEGYHNFHHEFPSDYRNALKWFQYDPTKHIISFFKAVGLASNLKEFPQNEIQKGRYKMTRKMLDQFGQTINWPKEKSELPVISFEEYQELSKKDDGRALILIAGFIHDVNKFVDSHPGGRALIRSYIGKDATVAFYGGIHDHNTAAHNMLAMMRVAVCKYGGEVEHIKKRLGHVQTPTPIFA
jgi:stearoyl-CoA desaturase (delta-9 desaturase)